MSSLQKFHRRTLSVGPPPTWPATIIGMGDVIHGFWLGTAGDGTSKLIVAPKSTETSLAWGSVGTYRNTTSLTNGLVNTNTLASFGQTAHPAAYYCKTLATGGYNTWYLPAQTELMTAYSNRSATPFANADQFSGNYHWTSTEYNGARAIIIYTMVNGSGGMVGNYSKSRGGGYHVRAVRRV